MRTKGKFGWKWAALAIALSYAVLGWAAASPAAAQSQPGERRADYRQVVVALLLAKPADAATENCGAPDAPLPPQSRPAASQADESPGAVLLAQGCRPGTKYCYGNCIPQFASCCFGMGGRYCDGSSGGCCGNGCCPPNTYCANVNGNLGCHRRF